jgi:polyhydroxybutyrate depolymerase
VHLVLRAAIVLLLVATASAHGDDCPIAAPCHVASGDYVLRFPAGWDGRSALPVLMFFHGYGDDPAGVLQRADVGPFVDHERLLLALPAGLDRRWHIRAEAAAPRDDLAFAGAVLDDLLARYPIDRTMIVAAGFSEGAFVTWTLACAQPGRFTGFLPIAGTFWDPVPAAPCRGGPVDLRHVHGTADPIVPLGGRRLPNGLKQGDVQAALATMARTDGCGRPPVESRADDLDCATWAGCTSGRALSFCTHGGGHEWRARWLSDGLAWLRRQHQRPPSP